jgi:hypothetical protein
VGLFQSQRAKNSQQEIGQKSSEDEQTNIDPRHSAGSTKSDGGVSNAHKERC